MTDKRVIAATLVIGVILIAGFLTLIFQNPQHVPPPSSLPEGDITPVVSGDLLLDAEAVFTQDFMPAIPPEGPPFYAFISINITNTGLKTVGNFSAPRATLYYNGTVEPFVTLELESAIQYFVPVELTPDENTTLEFINIRSEIFSPTIEEGTFLYARVLFLWGNMQEVVLTTAPSSVMFTY